MHIYDNTFFDAFKELEKLCVQIFGQAYGVSAYIDEMEARPYNVTQQIPNWRDDYYKLKRCRHIRNQLAHDSTSDSTPLSQADDLAFIQDFRQRLMARTDPLSQAGALQPSQPQQKPQEPPIIIQTPNNPTPPPPRPYVPPYVPTRKDKFNRWWDDNRGWAGPIGCGCVIPAIIIAILAFVGWGIMNWGWEI